MYNAVFKVIRHSTVEPIGDGRALTLSNQTIALMRLYSTEMLRLGVYGKQPPSGPITACLGMKTSVGDAAAIV